MKPIKKQHFVLFLCVLLIGEELVKAKNILDEFEGYKRISQENNNDKNNEFFHNKNGHDDDDDNDNDGYDHHKSKEKHKETNSKRMKLVPQKTKVQCGGKKNWVTALFKGVKIFTKVANYASLGVTLGTNIYSAIRRCKDIEPMAEVYTNKYQDTYEKTKILARQVDKLQQQAEADQTFIEGTAEIFGKVLCKLNEIDQDSDTMLQTLNPEVRLVAINASREIEKLSEGAEVEYVDIESLYASPLQTALSIAVPATLLALPAGFALFKLARKRFTQRQIGIEGAKHKLKLKLPNKLVNAKRFLKAKFSSWIGKVQTRFQSHLSKVQGKFNRFFTKIGPLASKFTKVLSSALSVAGLAYLAFKDIKDMLDNCKKIKEQAKLAYDQVTDAYQQINGTLQDIKEHRDKMAWAWQLMRGNLTEDMFLKSVNKTMTVMKHAANQSRPMMEVSERIDTFLKVIKTTNELNATYNATEDLYDSLIKVPFAYVCYTNKINILNNVIRKCKYGDDSLKGSIEYEKNRFDESVERDPGSPKNCKDDMGIDYLTDESIKQSWLGTAQENGFHPICYMNNQGTRELICEKHLIDGWDAAKIATQYSKDQDEVQQIIDLLPEEKPLIKFVRNFVCTERKKSKTDEEIQETLEKYRQSATLEQVRNVECNKENQGLCLPIQKAIQEAWEKQKIEMPKMPTIEEEEEEED